MSQPAIYLDNVSKAFGAQTVLKGISLSLSPGSVYGLVGLNGAGKTTLIRIILGLLKSSSGAVSVLGHDPWKHEPELYRQTGVMLESDGFSGNLTFHRNMQIFAAAKGLAPREALDYLAQFRQSTELVDSRKKVKYFSRGQKMQCAMARAFLGWPHLCLFDEPVAALDVDAYDHFCRLVTRACERGAAIIISSHQLDAIEDLCDSVGILQDTHLKPLENHDVHSSGRLWKIKADFSPQLESRIKAYASDEIVYKDECWFFSLREPKLQIPALIRELINTGESLYEVSPVADSIRTRIRKIYLQE
ncbi:MAG: ATP-binding cassette domain-containing protein [Chitinivibrionales bacterium]|nr:ATP-binding cassette domain-containing protein [Chitinivibrionales bacterium]